MAEIVNLNKARKAKAKTESESRAAANRAKYGRTKAEKDNDRRAEERRQAVLAGKELDDRET
jgi:hypothetical protein